MILPKLPWRFWVAVGALVMVAAACSSGGTDSAAVTDDATGENAAYESLPVYRGTDWADDLQQELAKVLTGLIESEIGGFAVDDFAGRFVTVEDGVRVTPSPTCGDCPRVSMWITGGSAVFGLGQRDSGTVAAQLVELASADGIGLEVTNLGVPGRTLWQEYEDVAYRLAAANWSPPRHLGEPRRLQRCSRRGSLVEAASGDVELGAPNLLDHARVERWRELGFSMGSRTHEEVAEITVYRYQRVQQEMALMAEGQGIETAFFFQPDALGSETQFEPVADSWSRVPAEVAPTLAAQLEAVSTALEPSVVNLRTIHDDEPQSVFVDWVHQGEPGSATVAATIFETLRPILSSLAFG